MRKTYVLFFLALFVAAGSMMFISGVQQAHAQLQCPGNTAPCGPACSAFPTVAVPPNASAVTVNCASNMCGATQAQCDYHPKTVGFTCNAGYTLSNGQCVATSSSGGSSSASLSLSVDKTSVPVNTTYNFSLGGSGIKANTGNIFGNGLNASGLPVPGTNVASDSKATAGTYTYNSSATDNSGNPVAGNSVTVTVNAAAACTPSWSPAPSTVCSGVSFTQTDSNNCETPSTQTAIGTATCYACNGTTCSQVSSGTRGYLSSNCNNTCTPTPTFTIAPSPATIQVGGTQQYTGYYDPDGPSGPEASQTVSASSVVWSSSNTSAATIASSGVATGVAAGSTTISGTYNGITATANLNVQGTTADFSISVSPMSQSVAQGSSVAYTVTISPLNGFTGTVNLSKSNLTTGLSGTFSPTSVSGGGGTSQFTLSASASAALGASTFTITGTSGALSHSVTPTVNVTVGSPQSPTVSDTVPVDVYFCTSPSDPTPGCSAGGPAQCTVTASPENILTGMSSVLTWGCTGISSTTQCSVSGDNGAGTLWNSPSGWNGSSVTQTVRPHSTTNYTIQCTGVNPSSAQTRVNVGFFPLLREIIPRW